jgi:hypothetical protein
MPPHFRHHASDALLPADDAIRAPTTLSGETNPLALPTRSVHFWPTGTSHERRILQVNADSDAVRMRINLKGSGSPDVCIYSRRTGARVINLVWLGRAAAHLLFEPSDGPGEYEVYWRCAQADLDAPPPPEARWQELASEWARLAANGQRPLVPRVTLGRTEAFSVIGPDWPGPRDDGGYGSRRFSLGNVRARIRLEPADATAAAVRCAVEWRRHRWPSQTRLYLFHEAEPYRAVRNMALLAAPDPRASADEASERVEIVFQPEHGSGEYLLYYHAHATRHATYDGRDDVYGTTYEHSMQNLDIGWHNAHVRGRESLLPRATAFDIQARTHADRFDSMDRPATQLELRQMQSTPPPSPAAPMLLFPEDRRFPAKLSCQLPERWARTGPSRAISLTARPGEFFVWQVSVCAHGCAWMRMDAYGCVWMHMHGAWYAHGMSMV